MVEIDRSSPSICNIDTNTGNTCLIHWIKKDVVVPSQNYMMIGAYQYQN